MYSNAKLYRQAGLRGLVFGLSFLSLVGCDTSGQQEREPEAATPDLKQPIQTVTLNSAEALRVSLEKALIRPDMSGDERTWDEAFMVRIGLTAPPAMGPKFDIYLDDERVEEYGGWEGGIYFWVYDPARLQSLEGRTVSYQFDRSERSKIGTLLLGDPEQFRFVPEAELRNQ